MRNTKTNSQRTALISVYDKSNIEMIVDVLIKNNYRIISSGGTYNYIAKYLKGKSIENNQLVKIDDFTGSPEILGGRVKTLHPKIYGGILSDDSPSHLEDIKSNGLDFIDVVVVNLYPFEATIKNPSVKMSDAIEQIDIGGVSLLRAASKNYQHIICLSSPELYALGISIITEHKNMEDTIICSKCLEYRKYLAYLAMSYTAYYDASISSYFESQIDKNLSPKMDLDSDEKLSQSKYYTPSYVLKQNLRYGENPHQSASLYTQVWPYPSKNSLLNATQLHGKELSFNNIRDAEAAIQILDTVQNSQNNTLHTAVGIKHGNPCGVAVKNNILDAWKFCYKADSISIFGGILALSDTVDEVLAKELSKIFLEIIIAPNFTKAALIQLKKKKNIRLLKLPFKKDNTYQRRFKDTSSKQIVSLNGGILVQDQDIENISEKELICVTKKKASSSTLQDLLFAWSVCKYVKSNAIVIAKSMVSYGVGAGQMNRVGAAKIALEQAKTSNKVKGAVMASDAFFPMSDTVELAASFGIAAIIQPGGSIKDKDSIDACNNLGIAMYFTHKRHFLH